MKSNISTSVLEGTMARQMELLRRAQARAKKKQDAAYAQEVDVNLTRIRNYLLKAHE